MIVFVLLLHDDVCAFIHASVCVLCACACVCVCVRWPLLHQVQPTQGCGCFHDDPITSGDSGEAQPVSVFRQVLTVCLVSRQGVAELYN